MYLSGKEPRLLQVKEQLMNIFESLILDGSTHDEAGNKLGLKSPYVNAVRDWRNIWSLTDISVHQCIPNREIFISQNEDDDDIGFLID